MNDKEIEAMVDFTGNQTISRFEGIGIDFPFLPGSIVDANMESAMFTIYQTIAHLCKPSESPNLHPEMFTFEVWNYIFLKGSYPEKCAIPKDLLQKMR